ncbi:ATPase [Salmonella enterica subsp. enterica]|uniref:ATPase n=1 Tax=Salmonella enterica I TaxID=59201 RepID=A0A379WT15_SALET|nr:ATPase [Salmonella enterica subsp. enterica]
MPQRDFGIPRFTYDEGYFSFMAILPPGPHRRAASVRFGWRCAIAQTTRCCAIFKDTSTLYLEIVDYPGEWLLDLPMLAQDYLSWSRQMNGLLQGNALSGPQNGGNFATGSIRWRPPMKIGWRKIAAAWTDYLHQCKSQGLHFIQLDGLFCRRYGGRASVAVFPVAGCGTPSASQNWRRRINRPTLECCANALTTIAKKCQGFYKNHFLRFDRQIVLVDCLQPLNSGPQAFNDMRLALTQLMQSFHYGQRTLFRRLFSPVIDKLLFAATKADHVTLDQHANMVALLQQLIQDAWQNAAFEGISMDCLGWRRYSDHQRRD